MDEERIGFEAWINPLQFIPVDMPSTESSPQISADKILEYLQSPDSGNLEECIQRHKKIAAVPHFLPVVPAETHIKAKLIFPLRNAKGCYIVGNYLGTIALCGTVAEMVAILNFEMARLQLNGEVISAKAQENLFGNTFENLGQDRRVKVLLAFGVIDDNQRKKYDIIRTIRKKYLHLFSHEHTDIAVDAVEIFSAATSLVADLMNVSFHQGNIAINPLLARYLVENGFATKPHPNSEE